MDIDSTLDSEEFKNAFWLWFDNLSTTEKYIFWCYRSDTSEIYYYNKIYRHLLFKS